MLPIETLKPKNLLNYQIGKTNENLQVSKIQAVTLHRLLFKFPEGVMKAKPKMP